jgi:dihydrofolate synthase/folylpolyglutamate synthase
MTGMTVHSFDEATRLLHDRINLERLQSFASQDMEGRLEPLRQILTSLGNPETAYRTVHITGTKGKGSTCVMLESIFLESGYRVGRFTSPHLYSFTERLMIDGHACPADEFTELFFSVCERIEPDTLPLLTYFELLTLLAFVYFAQKQVDVAIFEVGLGGRLDATNICQPDVSVITSISYEHTAQLGSTLSDIATEKSGIIKSGVPVVTTVLHPEPQNIIRNMAKLIGSPLFVLDEHFFVRRSKIPEVSQYTFRYDARLPKFPVEWSLDAISLTMPGTHQVCNASGAISAFLLLQNGDSNRRNVRSKPTGDPHEMMRNALRNASLPLRVEIIRPNDESPTFIFDGAHNRASMQALVATMSEIFPNRRILLIFGASLGKDVEGMFAEIRGQCYHVFLTQASDSSRRFPPQELRSISALPEATLSVVENCKDAWKQCVRMAKQEDIICVTGSLYLAAELRQTYQGKY